MEVSAKWISSKQIVWEIFRDTAISEDVSHSDIYEWITDCLLLIGAPVQFLTKITGHVDNPHLDINNFRAKLPCDFIKVRQVAIDGYPATPSNNTFHNLMDGACCGINEIGTTATDGSFVDNFGNTFITNLGTKYNTIPLTYELNNDYITLSVKQGKVCMSYLAFALDCDGFPLIPDNISYKEAIKKFIIMKLDYIKYRQNPDSSGLRQLYEHSEREYSWYVGQAGNAAKSLDIGQMENLKNSLLRLKPRINEFSNFFSTLSNPEGRRIK